MVRSAASGIALALALAGCKALAPMDPDQTRIQPTAVLATRISGEGTRDFPAFESTSLSYTRANVQRNESSLKGSGAFTNLTGDSEVRIERLDRKLVWMLDAKNRQYGECPLKGCGSAIAKKPQLKRDADDDKGCRLRIGNTTVTVEPTGQKRIINGFDTEQYDIKWLVTFRDNASRKSISSISIDLWTTPVSPALKDASALEKTYARAREKILNLDAGPDGLVDLPPEAGRMINSYLFPNVTPADRAGFLVGARNLDKVQGMPILMTVKWNFSGEACSTDQSMKDIGDKPLFTLTSEVKSHKMEALHDSLFAPPKDYKRKK